VFTGIVEEVGRVESLERTSGRARLVVRAPRLAPEVRVGDSVAVNGACLTVTSVEGDRLSFDVVPESLGKTTLGALRHGLAVNLEGALRVGDRLSGHFVAGHVDGMGEVSSVREEGGQVTVRVRAPVSVAPFLLEKGSITVDGVSLTLFDVAEPSFSVALVPHTFAATTLSGLRPGSKVNLEADLLARWIAKRLSGRGGLTAEKLADAGFDVGDDAYKMDA
jgi:riboflavin synthase